MKTLEQFIQEDLKYGNTDLEAIFNDAEVDEMQNICKDYAVYVSKQSLKNAREKVEYEYQDYKEQIDYDFITDESNIPTL